MGRMIFAARLVVLIVALAATVLLTWTLARNLDEPRVGLVASLVCRHRSFRLSRGPIPIPTDLMNALMMVS